MDLVATTIIVIISIILFASIAFVIFSYFGWFGDTSIIEGFNNIQANLGSNGNLEVGTIKGKKKYAGGGDQLDIIGPVGIGYAGRVGEKLFVNGNARVKDEMKVGSLKIGNTTITEQHLKMLTGVQKMQIRLGNNGINSTGPDRPLVVTANEKTRDAYIENQSMTHRFWYLTL
jgi:hypothetical protein